MTKYRSVFRTILLSALVTCTGIRDAAAATPPAYTVTDLGTLDGTVSVGQGINASGQVTGGFGTSGNDSHAFLYDGTMHDLGTLGGTNSYGNGINASGQVTGSSYTTGNAASHDIFVHERQWHGGFEHADRSALRLGVANWKWNKRRGTDYGRGGDRWRATCISADPPCPSRRRSCCSPLACRYSLGGTRGNYALTGDVAHVDYATRRALPERHAVPALGPMTVSEIQIGGRTLILANQH